MAKTVENLDFSGLFKLDVLVHLDISSYTFYGLGLKKFLAFSSDKELIFFYIEPQTDRFEKSYQWDFLDNPVYAMCFEPSGTWLLILSDQKVLLVPFLPLFAPQNSFDLKWSISCVTVLPIGQVSKPSSVVWWLTKESENILIIGSKTGTITFYSLESQSIVGECRVLGEIVDLQMCFDDSLDLLALLITKGKSQHWKLILEHRSFGYNWLHQIRAHNDKDKRDSFISYIKQLSKDKITLFSQGGSKDDNKSQTVEYVLKPTEYLPLFRKGSNNWALSAQYVNGRHFLTAFELSEGTLILESLEEDAPSRTLRPQIKNDGLYIQGLWSQKLVYLLKKNEFEIHSASFSVVQGEALFGTKRDYTELWSAELIGDVIRAHLMSSKEPPASSKGWREPTFLCDLQLPRFSLEQCLVITNCGAYILNTVTDPCEWLVGSIMRGGAGAEQAAAALGAPVPPLLRAAADTLLARGKLPPAQYLYSLSQSPPDGWVARLGIFGRLNELALYKPTENVGSLGNGAITIKLLALLLKMANNYEEKFEPDVKITSLDTVELLELTSIAAAIGLWELVPKFSVQRGDAHLILDAIKFKNGVCRGALNCILNQRSLVPLMLEKNTKWLFDFIIEHRNEFDTIILKRMGLWLNPLQDQLRPVLRDLKNDVVSICVTRMKHLIVTFIYVASVIESREPLPDIIVETAQIPHTWKSLYVPRRSISCGFAHWALVDNGDAKISMTDVPVNTDVIGRVIDVACGRHHTLVLTENGIYSAGDNTYGQLGMGSAWAGSVGDSASAAGELAHVSCEWNAPVVKVAAGHYHSAAVDAGGRLYTWGWGVHGQLAQGSIDDEWSPKIVTKFQGRKVLSVGCGACHTVVLTKNGEVWACGAAVFGQLGSGRRDKSSLPVRVSLADTVQAIAVGSFHSLALTTKGQVYIWGASPQQVRATHARQQASPPSPTPGTTLSPTTAPPQIDPHLTPALVDLQNVRGQIVQLTAGWHHSCLLTNDGSIYTWGLNFDGQLGRGDRKQVPIPTKVRIQTDVPKTVSPQTPEVENKEFRTRALAACGGDFTVYVDDDGRVFANGNNHQQPPFDKDKARNRVFMMKTTKRVIKIPANRTENKFLFQFIDRIDSMFPTYYENAKRQPIEPHQNPLTWLGDFYRKSWADDIILLLKPWIHKENLTDNLNMSAKLFYHNKMYGECLKLLLDSLKITPQEDTLYFNHTEISSENMDENSNSLQKGEIKVNITNIMSKRIKEVSLTILNDESYPEIDPEVYRSLPCCCDEFNHLPKDITMSSILLKSEKNLSTKAATVIDKCISIFPVEAFLWEQCFRQAKDFFIDNELSIPDLEGVLRKYMETNETTMAAAILYSNDCSQYSEILTPKFYLNMCRQVLDTWS